MSTELAKAYEPAAVEAEAIRVWNEEKCFHAEPTDPGTPYSIVIPPPNVTAALHLGHALNNTLQDILTRAHRMMGDNAEWIPGTDHAGIATQTIVDKRLQAEGKPALKEFKRMEAAAEGGREQFLKKVYDWKDEYEAKITHQLKVMGCSCDYDRQAFTMDEPRAKAVREAFFQLFKDGLIYRGKRLVNWDPVSQTALADDEVENEEVDGNFYYLRYPLVDADSRITGLQPVSDAQRENENDPPAAEHGLQTRDTTWVTVATTRPETMLGDTAVAINPKDPRAASLRGKKLLLPIVNREIPIIEDDYVVLPVSLGGDEKDPKAQFATGFLKVTPAHDPNDYDIGQRHKLAMINVMGPDASISDKHGWTDVGDAGFLIGKSREEARKLVVKWFKDNGLLEEIKPYKHSVGHSYRSHVPIEPWLSDQWYCKVTDDRLAGAALRAMARDQFDSTGSAGVSPASPSEKGERGRDARATLEELRFFPARYAKTFQTWHENIRDWCISRQLWWGHRIPVWSRVDTAWDVEEMGRPLSNWEKSDRLAFAPSGDDRTRGGENAGKPESWLSHFVCVRDPDGEDREIVVFLEQHGFRQDPDVLDTWFSSGLWPLSTLGWPAESAISDLKSALNVWNPTSVLCTAREIITLWVSRMVMFNCYFLNRLPFKEVFIHAMIQDGHGQKMSKTLGNGLDPLDVIQTHGADALRFAMASMATNTQDVRMPVDVVDPYSGESFQPKWATASGGYTVAAPVQESPKHPGKKFVTSYGVASGQVKPSAEMPVAKNTSGKFDLGRNFCNKLWNASRFVLANLEQTSSVVATPASRRGAAANPSGPGDATPSLDAARQRDAGVATTVRPETGVPTEPVDELKWSMADRWVVSRFNRTVADCNDALKNYRFDQYAKACYDFFWRDFCDWYVEASKPAMKDAARAPQTANILATVLDGTLRLLHPMIPFITETIWWKLNDVRPHRGIPNRLESGAASKRLVGAPWPQVGDFAEAAEHIFPKLQDVITAIRTIRNEHKVDVKKPVSVSILAPGDSARQLNDAKEMIELLATCTLKDVRADLAPIEKAAKATAAGCEIFVEGVVDEGAEQQRSAKRVEELNKEIKALEGRLANPSYASKAPPHLVQQTKDQLTKAQEELRKLTGA